MKEQLVSMKIEGPIITEDFPLHEVIVILENFHSILDQAYLVLAGKSRMTKIERNNFRIFSSKPRSGSLVQDLKIIYEMTQPFLPLIPILSSSDIWKSTKAAFDFLKIVIDLKRNGKQYDISFPNNSGTVILSSQGSQPINLTTNVFNIADHSLECYKSMTNMIEEDGIRYISVTDNSKNSIILTSEEKKLFNPETKLEQNPINVTGKIFDFNTEKLIGKLRVLDGQLIPSKDYNFSLIGNQDYIPYVLAMTVPEITINCLTEVEQHTTGTKSIYRLQALRLINS